MKAYAELKYLEAYDEANRACDAFQAACVKQFGKGKAADGRYGQQLSLREVA